MIQPLLTLDEARAELADSEADLHRVQNATRVVDPERQREAAGRAMWWVLRQRMQVRELEAAS